MNEGRSRSDTDTARVNLDADRDFRAYLIRKQAGPLLMWHRRRRRFVPYFDSESPPYSTVTRAFAAARRMRIDLHLEAVAVCELARCYPDRFSRVAA
jgi:hypothetical protein